MHPTLLVLQDVLDHRLEGEARLAVDEHLVACETCRRQLHALRWTRLRLAGVSGKVALPSDLCADLRRLLGAAGDQSAGPLFPARPAPSPDEGWRRWFAWWRKTGAD